MRKLTEKHLLSLHLAKRSINRLAGVNGVDFGLTYKNGLSRGRYGVRFHVEKKVPLDQLKSEQRIPDKLNEVPCDVVEASYQLHGQSPRTAFDPIRPGISVGNLPRNKTGTLGLIVADRETGDRCILGNWHVLAGSSQSISGEVITQPGPRHLGSNPPRIIAELLRWTDLSHGYDAAVAKVKENVASINLGLGTEISPINLAEATVRMKLVKNGVSSGLTNAVVDGVEGTYKVTYDGVERWMDGIRLVPDTDGSVDEVSLEGDSGAVWFDPVKRTAVALHFAGEDGLGPLAEYGLAHPIIRVFDLLDIALF